MGYLIVGFGAVVTSAALIACLFRTSVEECSNPTALTSRETRVF